MQIYRPGMGKFSSQTISGKSDEGSEFATASGGNSADESRSNSKQPDENTGKKFTNFIINNLGKLRWLAAPYLDFSGTLFFS